MSDSNSYKKRGKFTTYIVRDAVALAASCNKDGGVNVAYKILKTLDEAIEEIEDLVMQAACRIVRNGKPYTVQESDWRDDKTVRNAVMEVAMTVGGVNVVDDEGKVRIAIYCGVDD